MLCRPFTLLQEWDQWVNIVATIKRKNRKFFLFFFLMKKNYLQRIFLPQTSLFAEVISYYMAEHFKRASIFSLIIYRIIESFIWKTHSSSSSSPAVKIHAVVGSSGWRGPRRIMQSISLPWGGSTVPMSFSKGVCLTSVEKPLILKSSWSACSRLFLFLSLEGVPSYPTGIVLSVI